MKIIIQLLIFSHFMLRVASKCEYTESDVCDIHKHSQLLEKILKVQKQLSEGTLNDDSLEVCRKAVCLTKKCVDSIAKWAYLTQWYCWSKYKTSECEEMGRLYAPHLHYVTKNTKLSVNEICAILLVERFAKDSKILNWTVTLPNKIKRNIDFNANPQRILHISDIHYDPFYEPGSIVNCVGFVCCRRESQSSNAIEGDGSAGYWGELWSRDRSSGVCGAPFSLIEKTFEYISRTQNIDIILWTGDNTCHLAGSFKEMILQTSKILTNLLTKYFRNAKIFVALGDNEGLPNSQFAFVGYGKVETFILYEEFGRLWRNWINGHRSLTTFIKGGFYSKTVNNIKIISLNTNLCSKRNLWILYDPVDPGSQLKWLITELLESENLNQKVMIIGHSSPNLKNSVHSWVTNYLKILERFHHILIGTYFGHSHYDEFDVYYASEGRPISYGLTVGSFVTNNPSYRLYSLNKNGIMSDAETYFLNLTDINAKGADATIIYEKLYSIKKDYKVNSVNADQLDKLYRRILLNNTLLQIYFKNSGLRSVNLPNVCDENCKQKYVYKYIPVKGDDIKPDGEIKKNESSQSIFIISVILSVTFCCFLIATALILKLRIN